GAGSEPAGAPGAAPIEGAVPGRDEQVAARWVDNHTSAGPDRRVALGARRRVDESAPVAAERVPDVDEPPRSRVDRRDVALIWRRVADVPARPDEDETAREIQR